VDIDLSVVLDYLVPDSPTDAGAILLWVLLILLIILVVANIRMYLEYRNPPWKEEQRPQGLCVEQMKKSEGEPKQSYADIRTKVDQLIEMNNL